MISSAVLALESTVIAYLSSLDDGASQQLQQKQHWLRLTSSSSNYVRMLSHKVAQHYGLCTATIMGQAHMTGGPAASIVVSGDSEPPPSSAVITQRRDGGRRGIGPAAVSAAAPATKGVQQVIASVQVLASGSEGRDHHQWKEVCTKSASQGHANGKRYVRNQLARAMQVI